MIEDQGEDNLTSLSRKVIQQINLETISKHVKDENVMGSIQHGFTKEKSCLTNLTAYYEMTSLVDGEL